MDKRIIAGLAVVLFSIFALVNSAFADFEKIYTVGSEGSTTPKDSFDWDEQPWLYLELPSSNWNVTGSWWKDPDGTPYFTGSLPTTSDKIWLSLDNWFTVREVGQWNVSAVYFYANPEDPVGGGFAKFTVTPEPVSSILFLVGGASLAATRLRRRKK